MSGPVTTDMGDHLRVGKPPRYATKTNSASYPMRTGNEMSTGQNAVMLCSWGVKAGWLILLVDKRVGGR